MENNTKTKFWILLTTIFLTQVYLVSALTVDSVNTNPSEIQPGEKFNLELKIENDLQEDIENVVVSLDLSSDVSPITGQVIYQPPFAPYQSSNKIVIETIDEGDDERVSFDLITFSDASSGTYNIPVQVSYTGADTGDNDEDDFLVSVIINAKPKIDMSSEGDVLIKGTNGKILIKIVNSGLGDSKFLSVSLNPISGMQITSSSKVYIGNIDSNDFDTADFNVFVNADAPSSLNLPIQLTYTDSRNKEITENKIISINTYTAKEATNLGLIGKNNTLAIILSIVGVLFLFLIYRRIRKRNRSKRNGQ